MWKIEELTFVTENYFRTNSIITAQRKFKTHFNTLYAPSRKVILRCAQNFRKTGSIHLKKKGSIRSTRTPQNIEKVQEVMERSPHKSIRRLSQEVGVSTSSTYRMLTLDLKLYPYKMQVTQQLKEKDKAARLEFAQWFVKKCDDNDEFLSLLITSDEAHFSLSGYVNRQNCRFWATDNPKEVFEKPLHSPRVTVWCALTSNEIIGPYFFEDDEGNAVTVNGKRYCALLRRYFIPKLKRKNLIHSAWFQQDGATCHTSKDSMALLREQFSGRLVSRWGDVSWPPRSPDLTPLDFFLWGYLKSKVYESNPKSVIDLKKNITAEIRAISPAIISKTFDNMKKRMKECIVQNGNFLFDVIFKK